MQKYLNAFVLLIACNVIIASSPPRPFEEVPTALHIYQPPASVQTFMDKIARIESNGNHQVVNRYGMMGLYQFSPTTVKTLGFDYTKDEFLQHRHIQDKVMLTYMQANERELNHLINRLDGRIIKGVKVNRAAVLAGAHFVGSGNMRKFLTDPDHQGITDGNGTTLVKYMSYFSNFHLPPVNL